METVDEEEGYGMWRLVGSLPQIASQVILEMILTRGGVLMEWTIIWIFCRRILMQAAVAAVARMSM